MVSSCGWDSIPCDIGVDVLCKAAKTTVNDVETFVETQPGPKVYCNYCATVTDGRDAGI